MTRASRRAGGRSEHAEPRRRGARRHRAPFAPPFRPRAVRERFARRRSRGRTPDRRLRQTVRPSSGERSRDRWRRRSWPVRSGSSRMRSGRCALVRRDRRRGHRGHRRRRGPGGQEAFEPLRDRLEAVIAQGPRARCSARPRRNETHHRADRLERGRAAVRRDRDDRGDDRQRPAPPARAPGAPRMGGPRPSRLEAAIEESLRLEPAAAVVDRYATTDSELRTRRYGGASSSASRSAPPTGIPPCSPTPTGSTRARRPRRHPRVISPSPTAPTCASGFTWPGWRPGPASRRSCADCPACGPTRGAVAGPGAGVPQAADAARPVAGHIGLPSSEIVPARVRGSRES